MHVEWQQSRKKTRASIPLFPLRVISLLFSQRRLSRPCEQPAPSIIVGFGYSTANFNNFFSLFYIVQIIYGWEGSNARIHPTSSPASSPRPRTLHFFSALVFLTQVAHTALKYIHTLHSSFSTSSFPLKSPFLPFLNSFQRVRQRRLHTSFILTPRFNIPVFKITSDRPLSLEARIDCNSNTSPSFF